MIISAIRSGMRSCWESSRATKFFATTSVALGALSYHLSRSPEKVVEDEVDFGGLEPDKLDQILERLERIEAAQGVAKAATPPKPKPPGELLSPEQIARTYCSGGNQGAAAFRQHFVQNGDVLLRTCLSEKQVKEIELKPIIEASNPFFYLSYLRDQIGVNRSDHFRILHEECCPLLFNSFKGNIDAEELVKSFGKLIGQLLSDWRDPTAKSSWLQSFFKTVAKAMPKWGAKGALKLFLKSDLLRDSLRKDYSGYIEAAKQRDNASMRSQLEGREERRAKNIMNWFDQSYPGLLDLDDEGAYCMIAHHYFGTKAYKSAQKAQATLVDLLFESKGFDTLWNKRSLFIAKSMMILEKPPEECRLEELAPVVEKWLKTVQDTKLKRIVLAAEKVYGQRAKIKDLPELLERLNAQVQSDLAADGSSRQ